MSPTCSQKSSGCFSAATVLSIASCTATCGARPVPLSPITQNLTGRSMPGFGWVEN